MLKMPEEWPSFGAYYPDFVVKVKRRTRDDNMMLLGALINSLKNPDKAVANHKLYHQSLMVMKESSGRWMTLRFNEKSDMNESDAVFRIEAMTEY